jgi:hypothetical protein
MSISFVTRSRHLKVVPALPRPTGSSITSYLSTARILHNSECSLFFMTLSMYLVSEEYPNSISHIFLAAIYLGMDASVSISVPLFESPGSASHVI